jgi:hypothetical protein
VTLEQTTVVVTTWGAWRAAHPKTTLLAQDGGIGRRYPLDPLGGRDAQGPIFPVGDVDPRQPVHEVVLGVTGPRGQALAFPRAAVQLALALPKLLHHHPRESWPRVPSALANPEQHRRGCC